MKPLWGLAAVALLGTAGVAGTVIVASFGGEKEVVQQIETATQAAEGDRPAPSLTPGPGLTLWRWMNVTILIPDGSGIAATPDVLYLDDQGTQSRPVVNVGKADPDNPESFSQVLVDAENGTIHRQQILREHAPDVALVLSTLAVSSFDRTTAPWPYNGEAPANAPREAAFGISFIRPDPAGGIIVEYVYSSFARGSATPADCETLAEAINLRNGRSSAFFGLDARTGSLCKELSSVHADDLAAFERYSADVRRCGDDTRC